MNKRLLLLLIIGVFLTGAVFLISRSSGRSLSSLALSGGLASLENMSEGQLRAYITEQENLINMTQSNILTYQNNKKPAEEALKNLGSVKSIANMTEAELRVYISEQDALIATAQANKVAAQAALSKFVAVVAEPVCGINRAVGSYRSDVYNWPDQVSGRGFCASGKLVGSAPSFPINLGASASWKCRSEQDSTKEVSCVTIKTLRASATPNPYLAGAIECRGIMTPTTDTNSSTFTVNWSVTSTVPLANSGSSWYWSGTDYESALITPLATKSIEKIYYSPGIKEIYVGHTLKDSEGTYTTKMSRCAIELVSPSIAAQSDATLLPVCGVNNISNYSPDRNTWADPVTSKGFCSNGVLSGATPTFPQYPLGADRTYNHVEWTCVSQVNPAIKSLCSAGQAGPLRYSTISNQNADATFYVSKCSGVRGPLAGSTTEDQIVWTSTQNSSVGSFAYSNGKLASYFGSLTPSNTGVYVHKHVQKYPRGATVNPYVTYIYNNTKRWAPSVQAVTVSCPVTTGTVSAITTR